MTSKEKIGLFTGTFDPLTNGHLDIIERASKLFDILYVGIFKNDSKNPLFTTDERKAMIEKEVASFENVKVIVHEKDLTVNIAKKLGVTSLVRSVRNAQDLAYESEMVFFNRQMTGVETILLVARPELEYINSTRVKEIFKLGGDVSPYLPAEILREMEKISD
ncbi:pantetheine-phosphate adenylyltransferase [Floricoccus penangensis]|uniref:pantetheine-phosphate adenylyltransferase n=1 Tax=Floricoccus penangensis TaxID=1859475 RepID=UPI00203E898D|nr:pantetheine-phosphate adenylyltransferase [Floricoccus penangensis]URZ87823.1 pantetheine-phosphate adenylyltransferase [Floricoccus penangensis]